MSDISELFATLTGLRIDGGCDHCDAYQTMRTVDGVHVITVHHDDWCPFYTRRTR